MSKLKIVLDAGHGPNTAGKRSPDGSLREYQFNSRVANLMRAELEKYEGVSIKFTHSDAQDVPLKTRTNEANAWKADVFVSLHANANTGKMGDWTGIETFVYTSKPKEAVKLATAVQKNLIAATGMRDRGVKYADFHVLRESHMTAILIEHGYMDSNNDLPLLKSDAFRKKCAEANVKSIVAFYGLKQKAGAAAPKAPAPKPATPKAPAPKASSSIYRVIVDGKQVGAYSKVGGMNAEVEKAVKAGKKSIEIKEVK